MGEPVSFTRDRLPVLVTVDFGLSADSSIFVEAPTPTVLPKSRKRVLDAGVEHLHNSVPEGGDEHFGTIL